jgi:DNA-binding HxlR family transcriptional regulator
MAATLQLVGDRWALLVIRELLFDNHRFDALARNIGAPRDRLSARLRDLEAAGLIERRQYQERPLRHEYHLTEAGRELAPVVQTLMAWGDKWAVEEPPVLLRHTCGHEFVASVRCEHCGEAASISDLAFESHAAGWDAHGSTDHDKPKQAPADTASL